MESCVEKTDLLERQARKLRRRIEDHLRHSPPDVLIKAAHLCGISIPKILMKSYDTDNLSSDE
jgi:hypothetical protein